MPPTPGAATPHPGVSGGPPLHKRWTEEAACREPGVDPAWFYPGREVPADDTTAQQVCARCPVRYICLQEAMGDRFGVWGGWKGELRKAARWMEHPCPWCGSPVSKFASAMFCGGRCLRAAINAEGVQAVEVDARLERIMEDARENERERRRDRGDPDEFPPFAQQTLELGVPAVAAG